MFPTEIKNAMLDVVEKTKNNDKLTVNFALAYGGRQEIVDSFKKILNDNPKITTNQISEALISKNLYLQSEPELVIRPGGESRTSNFLTWQSVYSEWIFVDKFWPEFTKKNLQDCVVEFNKRERRLGK